MFPLFIISAALLSATTTLAAPTPANQPLPSPPSPSSTTASLLPLYVNGIDVSKTTFTPAQNLSSTPAWHPSPTQSPTPPDTFTHINSTINVTIVRQEAAAPLFHIPSQDAQFFATFANASLAQQLQTGGHKPSDALPKDKLDIGAKLVGEQGGDHTVHVTVVRDPMTATGPFTWQDGGVVVDALVEWTRLWAVGSFAGCAGVLVTDGGDAVAQGSFCGISA